MDDWGWWIWFIPNGMNDSFKLRVYKVENCQGWLKTYWNKTEGASSFKCTVRMETMLIFKSTDNTTIGILCARWYVTKSMGCPEEYTADHIQSKTKH